MATGPKSFDEPLKAMLIPVERTLGDESGDSFISEMALKMVEELMKITVLDKAGKEKFNELIHQYEEL